MTEKEAAWKWVEDLSQMSWADGARLSQRDAYVLVQDREALKAEIEAWRGARNVVQSWVSTLPMRAQGTLLTGIRGCDLAPKTPVGIDERYGCSTGECSAERHLVAFFRFCVLNPADPREVDIPGAWFQSKPPDHWKPSQLGHYPQHWYAHLMHCFEVVGYLHPHPAIGNIAINIYQRLVRGLHLTPETKEEMLLRLTEDRIATGEVVS